MYQTYQKQSTVNPHQAAKIEKVVEKITDENIEKAVETKVQAAFTEAV